MRHNGLHPSEIHSQPTIARTVPRLPFRDEYLATPRYTERGSKEVPDLYANHHSHVFLTASSARYRAGERSGVGGVFTRALLAALKDLPLDKVRYSELLEYIEPTEDLQRSAPFL
jgi:hypothetical protein